MFHVRVFKTKILLLLQQPVDTADRQTKSNNCTGCLIQPTLMQNSIS